MLENLQRLWADASAGARTGLTIGSLIIAALLIWGVQQALRNDYQVLFADLDAQDAATIVSELERLKLPYKIGPDETSILVDAAQVHATRLRLMSKGVNLRGGVGFEIFSNNDFGMTDFAQRINYQRALQGELTRTISALEEVRQVRVHLVLPESGLFRKSGVKPKAAVTLAMKRGRKVNPQQVLGIQRLVAAAVPEIEASSVTIVDEQGMTLTRAADPDGTDGADGGAARMTAKSEIEQYITRKAVAVLDKAFGPGRAIVTVDVTLDHSQVRVTREDVIPANSRSTEGVMTRKRTTLGATGIAGAASGAADEAARYAGSSSEFEFQNGRRVEQTVSKPGGVQKISVAVLLPNALSPERAQDIRRVIAASVGLNAARGDELAISSLDQFAAGAPMLAPQAVVPPAATAAPNEEILPAARHGAAAADAPALQNAWWLAALALVLATAVIGWVLSRPRKPRLTAEARERLLQQLRAWLAEERLTPQERKG